MDLIYPIIALLVLWLTLLTFLLVRSLLHYRRLTRHVRSGDLVKIWEEYLTKAGQNESALSEAKRTLSGLALDSQKHFQKVGVVRFNPFNEVGGNQSFVVAFLDGAGAGVVISSLHGRDQTRVYAKPVKAFGADGFELSGEEKDAIHLARDS